jgi:peptidoglycan hydrolase CwlO-like protein
MKPLNLTAAAAAAVCFYLFAVGPTLAATERLEQQSADAAGRIDRLSGQLNQDRAGFDRASEQADSAAAREADLSGQIEQGAERAAALRGRLDEQTVDLGQTRKRLRRAERLLADRLASIYMGGPAETIDLVFASEDFGELSTRTEYLLAIREADQQLAGRVRSVRASLEASVERLGKLEQQAEAEVAALDAARSEITNVRTQAEASASKFASISTSRRSEIETLKVDIEAWERQVRKQEAKSAAEAEVEVAAQLGGPYAIPTYIVMCESGGNYAALNPSSGAGGAYQILPSTWEAYGGKGLPHEASKTEQDRVAALIYADSGTSPWVCG